MICPLNYDGLGFPYCQQGECALWMTPDNQCGLKTIAIALNYLMDVSFELRKYIKGQLEATKAAGKSVS